MKKNLEGIFLIVSAIIIAGAFIFVSNSLIQNQQTSQGISNTISVVGEGKSSVRPDTLQINLTISEMGSGTEDAQQKANQKAEQIQDILSKKGIDQKNIKTLNLNTYPEYDRSNNERKLLGYRSQQTLRIELDGDQYADDGSILINEISVVGNINIDSTSFVLKDKNKGMQEARQNAFDDAKEKAEQLAQAGGVKLGKPVMISDNNIYYDNSPIYYARDMVAGKGLEQEIAATPLLTPGQTEVTVSINVVYEIK